MNFIDLISQIAVDFVGIIGIMILEYQITINIK